MNNAPFRYKTIVVNGKLETVLADEGAEYAAEKLARDKRELRDMIAGNVQFFDDPLARPTPPDASAAPQVCERGWYTAVSSLTGAIVAFFWDGTNWTAWALSINSIILPLINHTARLERGFRIVSGPYEQPTFP
jgi:hypothetical protein